MYHVPSLKYTGLFPAFCSIFWYSSIMEYPQLSNFSVAHLCGILHFNLKLINFLFQPCVKCGIRNSVASADFNYTEWFSGFMYFSYEFIQSPLNALFLLQPNYVIAAVVDILTYIFGKR